MTLGELIIVLRKESPSKVVKLGFNNPNSYRGYYDQLAFELARKVSVSSMLRCAEESLGKVFEGYKGGDFKMDEWTEVWLAAYGSCGDQLSGLLLEYMLKDEVKEGH